MSTASRWFLGVDGGGTKTAAAIVDERGRIVALAEGGPSIHRAHGWAVAMRAVSATIVRAERKARLRPTYTAGCFAAGLFGVYLAYHISRGRLSFRRKQV